MNQKPKDESRSDSCASPCSTCDGWGWCQPSQSEEGFKCPDCDGTNIHDVPKRTMESALVDMIQRARGLIENGKFDSPSEADDWLTDAVFILSNVQDEGSAPSTNAATKKVHQNEN